MPFRFERSGSLGADVLTRLIPLWGKSTTTGNVTHLRAAFSTSGYQVTAGKSLYLAKLHVAALNPAVDLLTNLKIGYADNDVGLDTTTARTNPVMTFGLDDANNNGLGFSGLPTADLPLTGFFHAPDSVKGIFCKIGAASKFPFALIARHTSGVNFSRFAIFAWCVEV